MSILFFPKVKHLKLKTNLFDLTVIYRALARYLALLLTPGIYLWAKLIKIRDFKL